MRTRIIYILFTFLFFSTSVSAQKKIFRLIRKEKIDKAIEYGEKKHKKYSSYEDNAAAEKRDMIALEGLGKAYYLKGDLTNAERRYTKAYNIAKKKLSKRKRRQKYYYEAVNDLAYFYLQTGNYLAAEEKAIEADSLYQIRYNDNNPIRYRPYLTLGILHYKFDNNDTAAFLLKKYAKAIKYSNFTNKYEVDRYAEIFHTLTLIELEKNNFKNAGKYAHKNYHYQRHLWTEMEVGANNVKKVQAMNLLADYYRTVGNFKKAHKYADKSLKFFNKKIGYNDRLLADTYFTYGKIAFAEDSLRDANEYLDKATSNILNYIKNNFAGLSEYEKENFYANLKENIEYYYSFAYKYINTYPEDSTTAKLKQQVYDYQLTTKALLLNEANKFLEKIRNSDNPKVEELYTKLKDIKNEYATVVSNSGDLDKIKALQSSINSTEKQIINLVSDGKGEKEVTWKDVRSKLKPDQAAIEMLRTVYFDTIRVVDNSKRKPKKILIHDLTDSSAYLALTLFDNSLTPKAVSLSNGSELDNKYGSYYSNSILLKNKDDYSYEQFWAPIKSTLGDRKAVYFSADGIYNLINLNTLYNNNTEEYLFDEIKIYNVTNTRTLTEEKDKLKFESALLVGNPNYTIHENTPDLISKPFSALPGTEKEVSMVDSIFKANGLKSILLLNDQASVQNIKNQEPVNLIHIATHGFFIDDASTKNNPMINSGLAFAGANEKYYYEEGEPILTAYKASNLDLNGTQIVILSACETGLGKIKNGEGVYGLQRSFQVAGVQDIVMSMWKVDDQATQELMVTFYTELFSGKNVYEALSIAEEKTREKHPEPYYWGPFKLLGIY